MKLAIYLSSDTSLVKTWSGPANTHDGMALDVRQPPSTCTCLQCYVDKCLFLAARQSIQAVVFPVRLNMSYLHENVFCQGV